MLTYPSLDPTYSPTPIAIVALSLTHSRPHTPSCARLPPLPPHISLSHKHKSLTSFSQRSRSSNSSDLLPAWAICARATTSPCGSSLFLLHRLSLSLRRHTHRRLASTSQRPPPRAHAPIASPRSRPTTFHARSHDGYGGGGGGTTRSVDR